MLAPDQRWSKLISWFRVNGSPKTAAFINPADILWRVSDLTDTLQIPLLPEEAHAYESFEYLLTATLCEEVLK